MIKQEINKLFYVDKNYSKIKELLKSYSDSWSFNILGKISLYEGNGETAYQYFKKNNSIFYCCYCKFVMGKTNEAQIMLEEIKNKSSAVNWLIFLTGLLNDNIKENPTYLEIKNFYEQDLEMLFVYKQKLMIQKIINNIKYIENFNREVYKYSARVLLNNNYTSMAENAIKKSLEIYYKDPETHYILGEIYLKQNNKKKALSEFKKAINVNGRYYPAEKQLKIQQD